jgi:hypothetical protein
MMEERKTRVGFLSSIILLSIRLLCSRTSDEADTGEEEDTAHDDVNEGSLRNAPLCEVDAAINQTNKTR